MLKQKNLELTLPELAVLGHNGQATSEQRNEARANFHFRIAEVAPPVFNLTYVLNTGVSFGLFGGGAGRWILSVFSVVVAGLLAWWATRADRRLLVAAIGLVMGGAIGNVIDRIRFGGVVDFLDFSGTGLFPWIFNIADSGITVGVVLLILDSFLSERRSTVGAAHEKS